MLLAPRLMSARIGGQEVLAKRIDKSGSKARDTTEGQECHVYGM